MTLAGLCSLHKSVLSDLAKSRIFFWSRSSQAWIPGGSRSPRQNKKQKRNKKSWRSPRSSTRLQKFRYYPLSKFRSRDRSNFFAVGQVLSDCYEQVLPVSYICPIYIQTYLLRSSRYKLYILRSSTYNNIQIVHIEIIYMQLILLRIFICKLYTQKYHLNANYIYRDMIYMQIILTGISSICKLYLWRYHLL